MVYLRSSSVRFADEIIKSVSAFKKIGIDVALIELPKERLNRTFVKGQIDGIFLFDQSIQSQSNQIFTAPFGVISDGFYIIVAQSSDILNADQVFGKHMVTLLGLYSQLNIAKNLDVLITSLSSI